MTQRRLISRRVAIAELGKAGLAIMVLGTAACRDAGEGEPILVSTTATPPPSTTTTTAATTSTVPAPTSFARVNLAFVSAYILYRQEEAILVDTGVEGSAAAIEAALTAAGLGWTSIGNVILTHKHPDHIGSAAEVAARAPQAMFHAGAADLPAVESVVPAAPVGDGDRVSGLEIIATPGHTAGHVSVLDPAAGILVTGDALNGRSGAVAGADPSFSEDMTQANASVIKLSGFDFEVALFGHGEPLLEGAAEAVRALAADL